MDADRIAELPATRNATAFLSTIAACEGTLNAGPNGYKMLVGGRIINNLAKHPNIRVEFQQTDGTINYSTAFGRYQFVFATWERLAKKLHLTDMSPNSQDQAALELIAEAGAMPDVKSGNVLQAIEKCRGIWASLPGAKYKQRTRSVAFAVGAFIDAGGTLA